MSEAAQVNPSDQHEDDSASKPAEPGSSKESSSQQGAQLEMASSPSQAKSASLKANEIVQETKVQALAPDAEHARTGIEVASKRQGEDVVVVQVPSTVVPASPLHQPHKIRLVTITSESEPLTHQLPAQITQAVTAKQSVVPHEETKSVENEAPTAHLEAVESQHDEEKGEEHHHELEVQNDEEEGEEGEEGILSFLRERRFTFKGMSRPQRLISGLAIGQLFASALLLVLNYLPPKLLSLLPVTVSSTNETVGVPTAIFVAVILFFILSWSFLLSGAFHGPILMRVFVLIAFTCVLLLPAVADAMPFLGLIECLLLLGTLWLWGFVIFFIERRASKEREKLAPRPQTQSSAQTQPEFLIKPDWGLYLPTFLPVLGLLCLYFALLFCTYLLLGVENNALGEMLDIFYKTIDIHMNSLTFLLIPVLFLAGSDFAELGEAIVRSGATLFSRFRSRTPWPLAAITAVVAVLIIVQNLPNWVLLSNKALNYANWASSIFAQLAIGAIVLALLCGVVFIARLHRWPTLKVKPATLHVKTRVLVLALFYILVLSILLPSAIIGVFAYIQHPLYSKSPQPVVDALDFSVYKYSSKQSDFSIAYPSDWKPAVMESTDSTWVIFDGRQSSLAGRFDVRRYTLSVQPKVSFSAQLQIWLTSLCKHTCQPLVRPLPAQGLWQVFAFADEGAFSGIVWIRDLHGQHWLLYGLASPASIGQIKPVFDVIVNSWHADLHAAAPETDTMINEDIDATVHQISPLLIGLLPLLMGMLIGLPLLFWQRKQPGLLAVGAFYFLVLGITQFTYYLQHLAAPFISQVNYRDFYLSAFLIAVAVATLLMLLWMFLKQKITQEYTMLLSLLLLLNGGLGFVAFMYWIYGLALHNSLQDTQWIIILQALLLVVALGWDIFTSGENTSKGGPNSPRHTRLLLFFGYIMLVSTAVLYFSSQRSYPDGGPLKDLFFESENWPQQGLLFLGAPLVITTFLLQVTYWWGSRNQEAGSEKASPESQAGV